MPTPPGVGSENLADPMFTALVGAANAALPTVNIWDPSFDVPLDPNDPAFPTPAPVTLAELAAAIDAIQGKFVTVLNEQADAQRITQGDYAKTLVQLSQVSVGAAVQFVLGKDQAFWLAVKTQTDAMGAKTTNELTRWQIMVARAQFAKLKQELANSDSEFGVSEYQRLDVLPAQVQLTKEQVETAHAQTSDAKYYGGGAIQGQMGAQKELTVEQKGLVHEQMEGQRAQTLDTRQDGAVRTYTHTNPDGSTEQRLTGLLGVQRSLYGQQIYSYRDDGKVKAADMFSRLWMTMRTMDDEILPPDYARPPTPEVASNPYEMIFKKVREIVVGAGDTWTP